LIFTAFLASFILLIVKANQVLARHVEAIEVFNCIFGTKDVLVDDEGGTLGLRGVALANLSNFTVLAENVVEFIGANLVWEVADEEDAVDLGWELFLRIHFLIKIN
jgi:hypothetical protein